jgi:3-phenylpropionate/cinnamic acid dioxygenase small subunit
MSENRRQKIDSVIQLLLDERDIRAVLHRYAAALDQKDWALLSTCFVPDASAHYETIGLLEGYPAIEATCRGALMNMSKTQHLIGNVDITVDGNSARSSCYLHGQHVRQMTSGGDSNIIAGRYNDDLVRTEQGWRIRKRVLQVWWTFGNPAVHDPAPSEA